MGEDSQASVPDDRAIWAEEAGKVRLGGRKFTTPDSERTGRAKGTRSHNVEKCALSATGLCFFGRMQFVERCAVFQVETGITKELG
ncbi:unnamed protein product [Gongylonema pulchrum]|uniref:Uncharacterized protein n=1 Tax=Gongylonema pulchrum TaxID=637853 RepID=A0A183DDN3_9BILA|nr:unnamed protein product [Gongylonema pulchrum]